MKATRASLIESLLPPMNRRTGWAMVIMAVGLAAMVLLPDRDPIPTPSQQLHAAAIHGDADVAELALHQGAAIDTRDNIGMTPLIEAARAGHLEICKRLVRNGANVNAAAPVYGSALMQAALYDHLDVVRLLLHAGANPNYRNEFGTNAMQLAIQGSDFDVADELQTAIHHPCDR